MEKRIDAALLGVCALLIVAGYAAAILVWIERVF